MKNNGLKKLLENSLRIQIIASNEEGAIREFHRTQFPESDEIIAIEDIMNQLKPHFKMLGLKSFFLQVPN